MNISTFVIPKKKFDHLEQECMILASKISIKQNKPLSMLMLYKGRPYKINLIKNKDYLKKIDPFENEFEYNNITNIGDEIYCINRKDFLLYKGKITDIILVLEINKPSKLIYTVKIKKPKKVNINNLVINEDEIIFTEEEALHRYKIYLKEELKII